MKKRKEKECEVSDHSKKSRKSKESKCSWKEKPESDQSKSDGKEGDGKEESDGKESDENDESDERESNERNSFSEGFIQDDYKPPRHSSRFKIQKSYKGIPKLRIRRGCAHAKN